MNQFRTRLRVESLEERATPATTAQISSAMSQTSALAAQIRTFSRDYEWMSNVRFRAIVQNYVLNVYANSQNAIKVFNESKVSLAGQGGAVGPYVAQANRMIAMAQGNAAFAKHIAGWLGMNYVTPIPAAVVQPKVTAVSSTTADGSYSTGTVIPITVTFDKAVTVTGSPRLALNSGGTANFASGSNSTTLTFNYTVGATDAATDLDYSSTTALTLNGGTIKQQVGGVNARLTLVAPGTTGSLGAAKAIVITAANDSGMTNTMPDVNDASWVTGANGLKTWDVVTGTGAAAPSTGSVTVFYTGWLAANGTQFDARRSPQAPVTFALSGLIQGWQQGIPGMRPGGIRRLYVPAALGYGSAGSPPNIPADADLVFEIKLISSS